MNITVKYLGLLAEVTQKKEESFFFTGNSISDLMDLIYSKYDDLKKENFKIAQKQVLVTHDAKITGSEIALLPPFAGG